MEDIQTEMYKRERHYVNGWIEESKTPDDWRAMKARSWSGQGDYTPADAGEEPIRLDPNAPKVEEMDYLTQEIF